MVRTLRIILPLSILLIGLINNCTTSRAYTVQYEPALEQLVAESDEVCLRQRLFFFSARPCVSIKGEKDNTSGLVQYYLRYEIGTFDVDLPLGISLKIGEIWYNLKKSSTNYSDTIIVGSLLSPDVLGALTNGSGLTISYTNRSKTENFVLSEAQSAHFKEGFVRIQRLLESEQKMIIQKK